MEYQVEKHIVIKLTYAEAADLLHELQEYEGEETNALVDIIKRVLELAR